MPQVSSLRFQEGGNLTVSIKPAAAVEAGAQWNVDGSGWLASGATVSYLVAGSHTVSFNTITGWVTPASQQVTITDGWSATATGVYEPAGTLTVTITPPGAVSAGAQWSIDGGNTWNASGVTLTKPVGPYAVTFSTVTGWITPASQQVTINYNQNTPVTGIYVQQGYLTVTITPEGAVSAGAAWSIDSGNTWNTSGATLPNLNLGACTITFKPITDWNTPASQQISIASGQNTASGTYVRQTGSLAVTLTPSSAQWSIDGGNTWNASGATVGNIPTGSCTITFGSVTGWITPSPQQVTISYNQTATPTVNYVQLGSLTVTIGPQGAVSAGAWSIDGGNTWNASGATLPNLNLGSCTVTFKPITDWNTPASQQISIASGQNTASGTYVRQTGSLAVTLTPSSAQWSIDGGNTWNASGATVGNILTGSCAITFGSVTGWITPSPQQVTISYNQTATPTVNYVQLGSLTVTIGPQGAVSAGAWSIDGGNTWNASGAALPNLNLGSCTITFKPITDWNTPASQQISIASGQNTASGTYVRQTGSLAVTLTPSSAQWSIDGGNTWNASGATVGNIPTGSCTITFGSVTGWITPSPQQVTINYNQTATPTVNYVQLGSLTVTIGPQGAVSAGAWSIDGGNTWNASGATLPNLNLGSCTITFKPITDWNTPASQQISIASGQNTASGTYVQQTGSLSVTLTPSSAQWSIDGGKTWNASGATVSSIPVGSYTMTFSNVTGWITPSPQQVTINYNQTATPTVNYVQLGSLTVTIGPQGAVSAGAWSIDGGNTWNASGATLPNLNLGSCTITFKPITDWNTPASQQISIASGQNTASGTYVRQTGSLAVTLTPSSAQWSIDGGNTWNASGATVGNIPTGSCTITFGSVTGWITPSPQQVTISYNQTATPTVNYVQLGSLTVTIGPQGAV